MSEGYSVSEGRPFPMGATVSAQGTNFAIFSEHAEKVELCLFDEMGQTETARIMLPGNTDHVWHGFVEGVQAGALYGYRVYGPYEPQRGHRFNPNKLLLDPYAKRIDGAFHWSSIMYGYDADNPRQDLVKDKRDNSRDMPKCVVVAPLCSSEKERISEARPQVPWHKTIIYETHVKGFTQLNLAIPSSARGTFAGLAHPENLAYIKELGVTAIELLPVHGFIDESFLTAQGLSNYWGYNSLHFFAPHSGYLNDGDPAEFRHFTQAAHEAGLEVILDVVYNHTSEGNHLGPTLSFRGIDNASYYCLQAQDSRFYVNDTGCGNTLNLKHPRVLQMVMDSLRYWVTEMGVDGFRFDLATVLGRESHGFDPGSGFFDAIKQDPVLASVKMIAEPWDIGPGGYQLGNYPTGWSEWNDRYRDTCRRFWRGDPGMLPEFARRIHGSSDLFEHSGRKPSSSVNFITSHDGFTLADLVSYKNRHNEANNEQNSDGHHSNFSENYGVEGETDDDAILYVRERQKRNFLATLFLSQGTPMLLAGDELSRSQKGNNNAYCQDNEINWLDWQALTKKEISLSKFVSHLIKVRSSSPLLTSQRYIHKPDEPDGKISWCVNWINSYGEPMKDAQWAEQHAHCLGWVLEKIPVAEDSDKKSERLLVLFNSGNDDVLFRLPEDENVIGWKCLVDTRFIDGQGVPSCYEPRGEVPLMHKSLCLLKALFDGQDERD
ncbi:glycogen debranching protein GlgX [Saccharophagus degradans]|uniref:glycogen debranching protein GlgX n=1 Tax=Saccharophagus degradans TaxID=86304 RepID=UPI001C086011|nr:glycogen debranching protein GlgX [Saccharophagus degradans]MBU2987485.1 glycogen debranching protein GlgX [Saccharophagus degradans]